MTFETKRYDFTGYHSEHRDAARKLRKNMTPHEKRLWYDFLKEYPVKVYRQRSIDQFIVDFYCPKAHLVIELDGGQHYTTEGKEYDHIRTDLLEQYQFTVIRFSNREININFQQVCYTIDQIINERIQQYE